MVMPTTDVVLSEEQIVELSSIAQDFCQFSLKYFAMREEYLH